MSKPSVTVTDEFADDMEFLGAQDEIEDVPREDEVDGQLTGDFFPVWRENWPTVLMFLRLESQWHVLACADGEDQCLGLRRDALEFELRYSDGFPRRIWNQVKDDLIAMEAAALTVMNKALASRRRERALKSQKR